MYVDWFDPFLFVTVMGSGISSDIMYNFPYEGRWLRDCCYILQAIACLLFVYLHIIAIVYLWKAFRNKKLKKAFLDPGWGTYPMGLVTIVNFMVALSQRSDVSRSASHGLMVFCYILWWYDTVISVATAWGISFLIWSDRSHYINASSVDGSASTSAPKHPMRQYIQELRSTLLLCVLPIIVATSCSANMMIVAMKDGHFNRNVQLLTIVITAFLWTHGIIFVLVIIGIFFWSLYVNKMPKLTQVFSMFLVVGPLGQGSFGILQLSESVLDYVKKYYPMGSLDDGSKILYYSVPWSFKIVGLFLAMMLLSTGYFFTVISLISIASYSTKEEIVTVVNPDNTSVTKTTRIHHFHKGFWGMAFPLGTMCLGTHELFVQYNPYVPLGAFHVVGAIYGAGSVVWTITCLTGMLCVYVIPYYVREYRRKHPKVDTNDANITSDIEKLAGERKSNKDSDDETQSRPEHTEQGSTPNHTRSKVRIVETLPDRRSPSNVSFATHSDVTSNRTRDTENRLVIPRYKGVRDLGESVSIADTRDAKSSMFGPNSVLFDS